jgi:predicted ATPase
MTSQLFVITGSSGGGKSTLLEELARRGYSVVPEAGRQLVREQQSIGGIVKTGSALFGQLLFSRSMYLYDQAVGSLGAARYRAAERGSRTTQFNSELSIYPTRR